jgi:hypothetical protein
LDPNFKLVFVSVFLFVLSHNQLAFLHLSDKWDDEDEDGSDLDLRGDRLLKFWRNGGMGMILKK